MSNSLSKAAYLLAFTLISMAKPLVAQPNLTANPVSHDLVRVFINARCHCSAIDTLHLAPNAKGDPFPNAYRSLFVNAIYTEADGRIPFQVYYAEKQGAQLYLIQKGWCRHYSTLVPLPQPGWYFVRYFHGAKPALLEIDATAPRIIVRSFGKCELH